MCVRTWNLDGLNDFRVFCVSFSFVLIIGSSLYTELEVLPLQEDRTPRGACGERGLEVELCCNRAVRFGLA